MGTLQNRLPIGSNAKKTENVPFKYQLSNTFFIFQSALHLLEQNELSESDLDRLLQDICQKIQREFWLYRTV